MDKIRKIAEKYNLKVIEDAAQAAGAEYKGQKAGSLGLVGCFSFFPTKNLGCAGDGGIITTNDEGVYKQCLALRVHGSGINGLFSYGKQKDIDVSAEIIDFNGNLPKYFNFVLGHNSRLDALQAAILRVKLPFLESWNSTRRKFAEEYNDEIKNTEIIKPVCGGENLHIYYVYVILTEFRDELRKKMEDEGIATGVYFPIPLHLQKVFENLGYTEGDMPNAEYLAAHGLAIPMFAELTEKERSKVVNVINNFKKV